MQEEQDRGEFEKKAAMYKQLFAGETGCKALADLANMCFVNRTTVIPGQPYATHVNEGARGVYLYIKQMLEADLSRDRPNKQESVDELSLA